MPHKVAGESFIQKPTIESKTYNYGVEHQQLELTCRAEADFATKLSMMWVLPNNDIAQWVLSIGQENCPEIQVLIPNLLDIFRKGGRKLRAPFRKDIKPIRHDILPLAH